MSTIRFKSIVSYISPQMSFKSIQEIPIDNKQKEVLKTFGITDINYIMYLVKSKDLNLGTKFYFIERLFEHEYPWILEYLELFWDSIGLHKYIYDKNHGCKNIFEFYDCKYYYPFQKKRCYDCEKEDISTEIKRSKERYISLNNLF